MSQTENLVPRNGKWTYGCTCGGGKVTEVETPPNSRAIHIKQFATLIGPVTKIPYRVTSHQVSIDIDAADAEKWIEQGIATEPKPAQRGRLTRVPNGQK
jgi:hypothetical protein